MASVPYCPDEPRDLVFVGDLARDGSDTFLDIEMYPCETFTADFQFSETSPGVNRWGSAQLLSHYGVNDYGVSSQGWLINGSGGGSLPRTTEQTPFNGALGNYVSVIRKIRLWSDTPSDPNDLSKVVYSVTVHLVPRPGYNETGISIANAGGPVYNNSVIKLSMPNVSSTSYYYRVSLLPGGTLSLTGTLDNRHPTVVSNLLAQVTDGAGAVVRNLFHQFVSAGSTVALPTPGTTFTNPSSTEVRDYYIAFTTYVAARLYGAEITVQADAPQPVLSLFLDVAPFEFDPSSPKTTSDDVALYLPGADMNGVSLPVATVSGSGQPLRIYAAFVHPLNDNQIVPPPPGVTGIEFSLPNVSRWRGYAMNAGASDDTNPDFAFEGPTSIGFGNGTVVTATLLAKDYGGRVTLRAQPVRADQTAIGSFMEMQLPKDTNNNWIADRGWIAGGGGASPVSVADSDTEASWSDTDGADIASMNPIQPPNYGRVGDGLIRFEEYRGFVIQGVHTRTHPGHRDLFVSSSVKSPTTNLDDENQGLTFAAISLRDNQLRLHHVTPNEAPISEARLINARYFYGQYDAPPDTPGWVHRNQLALNIVNSAIPQPSDPNKYIFGETSGPCFNADGAPGVDDGQMVVDFLNVTIDVTRILERAAVTPVLIVPDQKNNEIRRTIGHEIGHGIHVMHRGDPEGNPCGDDAQTGDQKSLMTSEWGNGAGAGDNSSKYNGNDVKQMRLHHYDLQP